MVETQELNIQYIRVPVYVPSATTFNLTQPTCDYRVGSTFMQSKAIATYKVEKVYEDFTTSTFQQPQTFEWYPASSDSYGNTYGVVGAAALGPAGNIQTKQKWYNRKLWVSGLHTEVTKHCEGMKHYEIQTPLPGQTDHRSQGAINHFGEFKNTRPSAYANTFLENNEWFGFGDHDYQLVGQYITTLENAVNIANYIDALGQDVHNVNYWSHDFPDQAGLAQRTEGFAEYSVSRHGWV